ncbi:hypothetical protein C8R42DRAFT_582482 [Lentinula raphanica]|nr:hypothetical protein C8R42DRAFT_582482 [Lentinula raphanica]
MRGPGSNAVSELLNIEGVADALGLSFRTAKELDSIIDTKLPSSRPAFTRKEVVIAGESFDMYARDILECIRALYGNPGHAQFMCFAPERHYADTDRTLRLYHDFNTGKWWWDTQKAVEADKPGATIIPVILSSDKTQITLFRNKSAYPVYLTIGNLPKEIRRKPSQQGQILLAYLPTSRLEHITNKASRRRTIANLFHACMGELLKPMKHAGLEGVVMRSGDGVERRCHPILAAYVGDYPEQVLVTTAYSGDCPVCDTEKDDLGTYPCTHDYRDPQAAIDAAYLLDSDPDLWVEGCYNANLKPVQYPFWAELPYTNIFASITPDILHQLYQGVMKHLISWLVSICGADEIDARVRRLPPNHTIRIFRRGISTLSRISGAEHKQMCAFILGVVTDIPGLLRHQSSSLLTATRALLDFLYLASYPIHSSESLDQMDMALARFHEYREIFISCGPREHFNIPKLHFLCHYARAIRFYGTTDNYNTETTERLHIDFTKNAYRASNHKDEYPQMTRWLERREKMAYYANYLDWRSSGGATAVASPADVHAMSSIGARFDFPGAQRTLMDMQCQFTQKLARFPVKSVALSMLEDIQKGYHAVSFRHALKLFLVQYRDPSIPLNQLDDYAQFVVLPFKSLPVWQKLKFVNPDLFGKKTLDSISAYPRKYNRKGDMIREARFDTALVSLREGDDWKKCACSRIGRVRVIFSIPPQHLSTLIPPNLAFPSHLAYVEWFTKFPTAPETSSGLYCVKREMTRGGGRSASIVSLDSIVRSVHLFPKWGGSVPAEWTSETVLDTASSFLLNIFKDDHSYFNLA